MVPRSAEVAQDARSVLLRCLDESVTGALEGSVASVGNVAAYVMMGEIVASRGEDDEESLLRLLVNAGHLDATRVASVRDEVEGGGGLVGALQEIVSDDTLTAALFERFRENLYQFLRVVGEPAFQEMDAVFVENIQVGHDSRALVDELCRVRDAVAPIEADLNRVVWPGPSTVGSDVEARFTELCSPRITLRELLVRSPFERSRTLERVKSMLDGGTLESEETARRQPRRSPPLHAVKESTAPVRRTVGRALTPPPPDEHTEEVPAPPPGRVSRRGAPSSPPPPPKRALPSPEDWTEEDELAAFGDYDTSRGNGSFTATSDTLDRVELGDAPTNGRAVTPGAASNETVLEMVEADAAAAASAIRMSFAPPKLQDDEAIHKIEVVSEVLATVVAALDEAHGPGSGHARVQVLLEGSAGPYLLVFHDIELRPGGWLPAEKVLKNLRRRPATEHRNLLNAALGDVVERALSLASSTLDDQRLDRMLEKIAGFQSRFGV